MRSSTKAHTLGSHERAHHLCVRRRRAAFANWRRHRARRRRQAPTLQRRSGIAASSLASLGGLGVPYVMRAIGISTTFHAKSAEAAKKDRLAVASHSGLRRECSCARFCRESAPHPLCATLACRTRRRRPKLTTLQRGGSLRTALTGCGPVRPPPSTARKRAPSSPTIERPSRRRFCPRQRNRREIS